MSPSSVSAPVASGGRVAQVLGLRRRACAGRHVLGRAHRSVLHQRPRHVVPEHHAAHGGRLLRGDPSAEPAEVRLVDEVLRELPRHRAERRVGGVRLGGAAELRLETGHRHELTIDALGDRCQLSLLLGRWQRGERLRSGQPV